MTRRHALYPPAANRYNPAAALAAGIALAVADKTGWAWPLALGLWLGMKAGAFEVGR